MSFSFVAGQLFFICLIISFLWLRSFLHLNIKWSTVCSSSSSSIGTTAHCGLWPVEQCPSNFSYLPPTLSTFSRPALEDLFLLPLSIFSWVFPFFSSIPVFWVKLFLGILSPSILSRWPNQRILCPFVFQVHRSQNIKPQPTNAFFFCLVFGTKSTFLHCLLYLHLEGISASFCKLLKYAFWLLQFLYHASFIILYCDQQMHNYLYRCIVHFVVYLSNTPTNAHI